MTDTAKRARYVPRTAALGRLMLSRGEVDTDVHRMRRLRAAIDSDGSPLPAEPSAEAIAAVDAWLVDVRRSRW